MSPAVDLINKRFVSRGALVSERADTGWPVDLKRRGRVCKFVRGIRVSVEFYWYCSVGLGIRAIFQYRGRGNGETP